jgi:hypothetical protein
MPKPFTGALTAACVVMVTLPLAATHVGGGAARTGTDGDRAAVAASSATTSVPQRASASVLTAGNRLRVTFPRRAVTRSRISIRGTAPAGRRGRPVVLFRKDAGAFKRVASTKADARGRFTLSASAPRTVGRSTWKVEARRFGSRRAQSVTFRVTVTARRTEQNENPTGSPTGTANDWTYISANKSMRWDPCTAITWHYASERQAYPGAERDLIQALAMLSAKSGHTFTRVADESAAALTIRWATPAQEPMLAGSTVGVGGPSYQSISPDRNGGTEAVIVGGTVTFDATESARPGFADAAGWTWGQVFLHEVMHAMGLGHAREQVQVMYPMASTRNQHFGAGDLSGLAAVGATKGCIDTGYAVTAARVRTAVVAE